MLEVTQAEIDEAVIIGKYASYKLASELLMEEKYGGNTKCCYKRLKLVYAFTTALVCQKNSLASYLLAQLGTPGGIYIFTIGDESVTFTAPAFSSEGVLAAVELLNEAFENYTFEVESVAGQDVYGVRVTGTCTNFKLQSEDDKGNVYAVMTTNGNCMLCLDNEETRNLISKIKALCAN
jgi:hypothetical protein